MGCRARRWRSWFSKMMRTHAHWIESAAEFIENGPTSGQDCDKPAPRTRKPCFAYSRELTLGFRRACGIGAAEG